MYQFKFNTRQDAKEYADVLKSDGVKNVYHIGRKVLIRR